MLMTGARLYLFFAVLLAGSPATAQLACFDIFALKTADSVESDFRTIPMLDKYKYELDPENSRVYYLRNSGARAKYEWKLQDGKFFKIKDGKLIPLNTAVSKKDHNYDEVMDHPKVEFIMSPEKQFFGMTRDDHMRIYDETILSINHSTFLGGKPIFFAGNLIGELGLIKYLDNRSGHYSPSYEVFLTFLNWLTRQGVDLTRTQIRIDDIKDLLKDVSSIRKYEEYMPEIIFLAEMQSGYLRPEFLIEVKTRIDREFQETGDSLFLYRTNFIWDSLNPAARVFLESTAKAHGRTMPDPVASLPPH